MSRARVVGAGLSGLVAAWCLAEAGHDVELIEAAEAPGGLIGTTHTADGLVERAANAFVWNDVSARWFYRLGITPLFPRPTARRRYIYTRGRARRWPLSFGGSLQMATHLGAAVLRHRTRPIGDESVEAFGHRIVGRQATHQVLGPALQGIYGAAPAALCARLIFDGSRRGRREFAAPPGGMGEFVERLLETLRDRGVTFALGSRVERLDPSVPTVIATNAPNAARLVDAHAPALAAALEATSMSSLVTATAFFERDPGDLDGFGVLFPRDAGVSALGVLFNTSIFDGRGSRRSETWIRTAADPLPDDLVREQLLADRQRLTGRPQRLVSLHITRRCPALPVYGRSILDIQAHLGDLPSWIALAGNYLGRIGVSALLEYAEAASARIARGGR